VDEIDSLAFGMDITALVENDLGACGVYPGLYPKISK
jgi:hypothetical protein